MRISDWSSDVCSSDLAAVLPAVGEEEVLQRQGAPLPAPQQMQDGAGGDEQRRRIADRRAVGDVAAEGADIADLHRAEAAGRAEEGRVGKGGVSKSRTRWSPYHEKKKQNKSTKQHTTQEKHYKVRTKR